MSDKIKSGWKVWSDWQEEPEEPNGRPHCDYPELLAIYHAEKTHADVDYPSEHRISVRDPDGKVTRWAVRVEMEPQFYARQVHEEG